MIDQYLKKDVELLGGPYDGGTIHDFLWKLKVGQLLIITVPNEYDGRTYQHSYRVCRCGDLAEYVSTREVPA